MENNTSIISYVLLKIPLSIVLFLLLSSCTVSPFIPYAVELNPPNVVTPPKLPQVVSEPIKVNSDFQEFKSTIGEQRYLVPLRLTASADSTRARAIMLESHDGKRAIFQAIVGPPATPLGNGTIVLPILYPIDRMVVRTLTSPQDASHWRVTISSEPISSQPYTLLLNIQIFGEENIAGFKSLLRSDAGFLLEARFAINTPVNSRLELGVPISLHHLSITEQTM